MYLLNNKGFTLISLLISITTLLIITPLLVYILKFAFTIQPTYDIKNLELRHVHFHIQNELNKSISQQIQPTALTMINHDGSKITYELYNNIVRRRVNDSGHEIIIRDVTNFKVRELSENIFLISISKGDQHNFEKVYIRNTYQQVTLSSEK